MLREEHLMGTLMKMKLGEVLKFKAALASKVGSCPVCLHCIQCHKMSRNHSKSNDCDEDSKLIDKPFTNNSNSVTNSSRIDKNSSMMDESEKSSSKKTDKFSKLETNNIDSSNENSESNKQDVSKEIDEDE